MLFSTLVVPDNSSLSVALHTFMIACLTHLPAVHSWESESRAQRCVVALSLFLSFLLYLFHSVSSCSLFSQRTPKGSRTRVVPSDSPMWPNICGSLSCSSTFLSCLSAIPDENAVVSFTPSPVPPSPKGSSFVLEIAEDLQHSDNGRLHLRRNATASFRIRFSWFRDPFELDTSTSSF